MEFKRSHFNPQGRTLADGRIVCDFAKQGDAAASNYVYDDALVLAVNVALAARRPLLLAGEPGCGKTTLAANVARVLGWAYYQHTIASRSQAGELVWEVDTLGRLNDAYDPQRRLLGEEYYVQPGKLWWALAPQSAHHRGLSLSPADAEQHSVKFPAGHLESAGAVLLIDEIDKAEPDLPNDLLEVLDTRSFDVKAARIEAERAQGLIVITTNLERELPGAFMRRCVVYRFPDAGEGWFSGIALQRIGGLGETLAKQVEKRLLEHRQEARTRGQRVPGTAEYLDAITALQALEVRDENAPAWLQVERCIFGKHAALEQS